MPLTKPNTNNIRYTYDTVADMRADFARLRNGMYVRTAEHTAGAGYEGGNVYLIRSSTGAPADDGSIIGDLSNTFIEAVGTFPDGVNVKQFGAVADGVTETLAKLQAAADYVSSVGVAQSSVVDLLLPGGVYIVDVSVGSATEPTLKLKNYTRLTGSGVIKAKDSSYTAGNPPIIGNDQTASGNTRIYIDGIGVDANATNNVSTDKGAISILFGRSIGASGGPGQVSVDKGAITNIKCVDTSFIAVQVKDGASQISISNIENNGGHYAVQSANSKQIDISNIFTQNTQNNAVDIYGNMGDKFNISAKTGTYTRGETVTGSSSGATGRLILDNGAASIQLDKIVGTFTVADTMTGGSSGATATFVSKEFIKGNFTGSIRGVHANVCKTGVFLESVSDVPVSDCVIKSPTGNAVQINRINSITSGNRVSNVTVRNAVGAGVFLSGNVVDNFVSVSVDGADKGVEFNGGSFNTVSDCEILDTVRPYLVEGTGNKNTIKGGTINTAGSGIFVGASQSNTQIDRVGFVNLTGSRLTDNGTNTSYIQKEKGTYKESAGSGNLNPNLDSANIYRTEPQISANINVSEPTGFKVPGDKLTILLRQDGAGGHSVTFHAVYKIKTAASTIANKRSNYEFVWTGVFWEAVSELIDL